MPKWSVGGTSSSYRWLRDGVAIPGATGRSRKISGDDVASTLTVQVTGRRDGHADGHVSSRTVTVPKVATSTKLSLTGSRRAGHHAIAHVSISASGVTPTGRFEIRDRGYVVGFGRVVAADHGRTTVRLPRLTRRTHRYTIVFPGSATTRKSTSKTVKLVVR